MTGTGGGFKCYHLAIVDISQEEEELERERATLDDHDNRVTDQRSTALHSLFQDRPAAAFVLDTAECKTKVTIIQWSPFDIRPKSLTRLLARTGQEQSIFYYIRIKWSPRLFLAMCLQYVYFINQ